MVLGYAFGFRVWVWFEYEYGVFIFCVVILEGSFWLSGAIVILIAATTTNPIYQPQVCSVKQANFSKNCSIYAGASQPTKVGCYYASVGAYISYLHSYIMYNADFPEQKSAWL